MVVSSSFPDSQRGFTLVELLIAAAVGVLILSTLIAYWTNTLRVTSVAVLSRTALEDVRSAGNYMTDLVNQASYVFPPKSTLTLASSSGAYTVKNPNTGNASWTVGTDPIVAMFIPPQDASPCVTSTNTAGKGCIKFMAFYAVKRSVVMQPCGTGACGAERPNEDPFVPSDAWTVYQYIQNIAPPTPVSPIPDSMSQLLSNLNAAETIKNYSASGISGNLLADYIDNNGFQVSISECYTSKTSTNSVCPLTNADAKKSALAVNMILQSEIPRGRSNAASDQLKIPSSPMVYRAAPRNLTDPLN